MRTHSASRPGRVVARWLLGTALISWRYLWQITPLHRSEHEGQLRHDAPPELPAELVDDRTQLADTGVGPLYHRVFRVDILDARLSATDLVRRVVHDFGRFVPSEVVSVRLLDGAGDPLRVGDELVVEMPGPWDGPVRVVRATDTCLRLATLRGHLEAGQVQFRAFPAEDALRFEIEAWARPSTHLVRLLYCVVRLAKEIQLNMWVRFCRAAAREAGGRLRNGVTIRTFQLAPGADAQRVVP